jgi:hypothetical protein
MAICFSHVQPINTLYSKLRDNIISYFAILFLAHVVIIYEYMLYTVSRFAVQPDDGLDIAKTYSCVFTNNKTNVGYTQLNFVIAQMYKTQQDE